MEQRALNGLVKLGLGLIWSWHLGSNLNTELEIFNLIR